MNTIQLTSVESLSGFTLGAAANPDRSCPIQVKLSSSYAGNGTGGALVSQIFDKATETYTIAISTTVDYDLTSGQIDPLGDACVFTKVKEIYLEHVAGSLATSGIKFSTVATNGFVGPFSAAATVTLLPGEVMHLKSPTSAGWTVDGTHKVVRIINLDGTALHVATVKLFIAGG